MVHHSLRGLAALLVLLLLPSGAAVAAKNVATRPGIMRLITSGTTDTATLSDIGGTISWKSPTTGAKTQTLPACTSPFNGLFIGITDEQGNAATYPISVTAGGGSTVAGAAAPALITSNLGSVLLGCDQTGTGNWAIISGISTVGQINWPNQNFTSPPSALTDGASIPVNASGPGNYTLTLLGGTTASPHTLACPTGLGSGVQYLSIDITQGAGGPYPLAAAGGGCYLVPSGSAIGLTQTVGATDTATFKCIGSTCRLGGLALNLLAPAAPKTFIRGVLGPYTTSGTTTTATFASAVPVGSTIFCGLVNSGTVAPSGVASGAVTFTNVDSNTSLSSWGLRTYQAVVTSASVTTVTATWAASNTNMQMLCDAYAGGTSADGHAIAGQVTPGTSTDAVSAGSITPTSSGDLAWGVSFNSVGTSAQTQGTGFTLREQEATTTAWGGTSEDKTVVGVAATPVTFTNSNVSANVYSGTIFLH